MFIFSKTPLIKLLEPSIARKPFYCQ